MHCSCHNTYTLHHHNKNINFYALLYILRVCTKWASNAQVKAECKYIFSAVVTKAMNGKDFMTRKTNKSYHTCLVLSMYTYNSVCLLSAGAALK